MKPRLLELKLKGLQKTTGGLPCSQCICCNIEDACVVEVEQDPWISENRCTRKASRCQSMGVQPWLVSVKNKFNESHRQLTESTQLLNKWAQNANRNQGLWPEVLPKSYVRKASYLGPSLTDFETSLWNFTCHGRLYH